MKDGLRVVVALAFLWGLAGCNMVVSEEPWFTAADAAPEPILRDGLWLQAAPDCRVDAAKPVERWPDCADASFVRGDERWSMRWDEIDERGWRRRTFAGWESGDSGSDGLFVANGDHLIFQMATGAKAEALEHEGHEFEEQESGGYIYGAVRPTRYDPANKVTAMEIWVVRCGPLPEPKRSDPARRRGRTGRDEADEASSVTDRPFPGLTVVESNCIAQNVETLRQAAVLSEHIGNKERSHWVREGWR